MKKFSFLIVLVLVLFSCKKDKTGNNNTPTQLWPLKVGNNWTFMYKEFGEGGNVLGSDTYKTMITGTVNMNNKTYFIWTYDFLAGDTLLLVRSDDKHVYYYSETDNKETVLFKWPASNGEILYSLTSGVYKEEAVASTSQTDINTFQSYKVTTNLYENNTLGEYNELYFKPGIGITGSRDYTLKRSGSGMYKYLESTLISYDLK